MSGNIAAQQSLAARLSTALRRFEHEGGDIDKLAKAVAEDTRDLRRWADGTKLPAHVLSALLGELPRHLADYLIAPTRLRLVACDAADSVNALLAAAAASRFSGNVAERQSDGQWCHRDEAETQQEARRLITELQPLAGE